MNLDQLYKQYAAHSHESGLEAVFEAGVKFGAEREANLHVELVDLRAKYQTLLQRINAPQQVPIANSASDEVKDLTAQALGMGKVFKK